MTSTPTHDPSVFERVLVRQVAREDHLHGALFHLWWSAPAQGDRLVQVYANDRLYTATLDPAQRELWLVFAPGRPQRIDLAAVRCSDAFVPRPTGSDIAASVPSDIARVTVLRDPGAPVGSVVGIAVDDGPEEAAPLFGADDARIGFGSVFGEGGFGLDAAVGPGLGLGGLGLGPLGSDGDAWRWSRDDLAAGPHPLTLTHKDKAGRALAPPTTHDITTDRLPPPPPSVTLRDDLTLAWS